MGVELPGDYADLVESNTITNNANNGVLGFEYPNPFTAGIKDTIFFQLAGNKIAEERVQQQRHSGKPADSKATSR